MRNFSVLFLYKREHMGKFSNLHQCTFNRDSRTQLDVLKRFTKFKGTHLCQIKLVFLSEFYNIFMSIFSPLDNYSFLLDPFTAFDINYLIKVIKMKNSCERNVKNGILTLNNIGSLNHWRQTKATTYKLSRCYVSCHRNY